MARSRCCVCIGTMLFVSSSRSVAFAEDAGADAAAQEPTQASRGGILPIPDYTTEPVLQRGYLLGELGGARTALAEDGVQFRIDWTQHLQGVLNGGRDTGTRYGGSLEYVLSLDLDRMGVMPGAVISARGESRYGESINDLTGTLLPSNTDMYFPITSEDDDELAFALTELTYTQYLSSDFGVYLGRVNTLAGGGDPNEFASGRGLTQFQNANLTFNPVSALVPYSTLGAGVVWLPSPNATFTAGVLNSADSSTGSGFDDFGEGWTGSAELQFRYEPGGRPGGQNIGFIYGADGDYAELDGRVFLPPGSSLRSTSDETWSVYWTGWQYLWVDEADESPIDALNGVPDRRGFGLFARVGLADDDTVPVDWHASGGIGGRGLVPGRPDDHFGLGYYFNSVEPSRITSTSRIDDEAQGLEAYYNAAISPAVGVTASTQVLDDARARTDTATVLGLRVNVRF